MTAKIAVGIDLGTTNSAVAWVRDGKPEIIPGQGGNPITPSIVCVDESGHLIVGHQAKRRFLTHPQDTIYGAKRLMGRQFGSDEMDDIRSRFFYEIAEGDKNEAVIRAGSKTFSLEEISALVLTQLKDGAQETLGARIDRAVISVPAYFTQRQRDAVRTAGGMAGLEVLRIINEPTAAALSYGFGRREDQRILIYDLGGGTFDASILQLGQETYEVIGTGGDSFLGGIDFDNRVVDWFCTRFETETGVNVRDNKVALQRLRDAAERAKIDLSMAPETEVNLPFLAQKSGESLNFKLKFTRADYDEIVRPLVLATLKIVERTLVEASMTREDLDDVILVGGMTRSPIVADLTTRFFGRKPRKDVHPDEVVALGAGILADAINRGAAGATLRDVLPVSIGIGVGGGEFRKVINKNTPIPTLATQVYRSTRDNQPGVKLRVYQGESRQVARNEFLGELALRFPPLPAGQVQVEVRFAIDEDSILHVSARELATGREMKAEFKTETVARESYRADQMVTDGAAAVATAVPAAEPVGAPPVPVVDPVAPPVVTAPAAPGMWKRLWQRLFGSSPSA
jgi:molecular chaperone DnaK